MIADFEKIFLFGAKIKAGSVQYFLWVQLDLWTSWAHLMIRGCQYFPNGSLAPKKALAQYKTASGHFLRRNWFWSRFGWSVPASSHGLSPALHRVPIESGFLKTFFSHNWFRSWSRLHSSGHQVTARPASVPGLNASTSKPNSARRFLLCKAKSGTFLLFYINMSWW